MNQTRVNRMSNTITKEQHLRQNQKLESSTFMTDVIQVDDDSFLPSGEDILVALFFFIPGMIYLIITFPIWFPCLSVGILLSPILIGVPCASIGSGIGGPGFCLLRKLILYVVLFDEKRTSTYILKTIFLIVFFLHKKSASFCHMERCYSSRCCFGHVS